MRRREAMDWIGRMNNWKCGVWLNNLGMNEWMNEWMNMDLFLWASWVGWQVDQEQITVQSLLSNNHNTTLHNIFKKCFSVTNFTHINPFFLFNTHINPCKN
jgi:hypothetical protein